MIKKLFAGLPLLLFAGLTFAQSPTSIPASHKESTHTITVNDLQTVTDTVRISDVFDRIHDRVTSIRYDVANHSVILTAEPTLRTEDLMEILFMAGFTSSYTRENKRVTMLTDGKLETTEVK